MHSDPLQELIHGEVCISFRGTHKELLKYNLMRKTFISFKIKKPFNSYFTKPKK